MLSSLEYLWFLFKTNNVYSNFMVALALLLESSFYLEGVLVAWGFTAFTEGLGTV